MSRLLIVLAGLMVSSSFPAQQPEKKPPLPPVITSDMVLPHGGIKPSSVPNDPRIYWKGDDGKVNRLKQLAKYPKFPKEDYKLKEREVAQYHFGRDFPTPEPTQFKAGVHGTVMYAEKDKGIVLVGLPNGNVIHYLHASEVEVTVGYSVTPDDVLGKTSNHLHIQATDKNRKLLDVDQAFLAGREKPKEYTPFRIPRLDFVDLPPLTVGDKKPVVVDGVLQYEPTKRFFYDENAVKSLYLGRYEADYGYDGHKIIEIAPEGKYFTGGSGQVDAQKGADHSYRIADAWLEEYKKKKISRKWKTSESGKLILEDFWAQGSVIGKLEGETLRMHLIADPNYGSAKLVFNARHEEVVAGAEYVESGAAPDPARNAGS